MYYSEQFYKLCIIIIYINVIIIINYILALPYLICLGKSWGAAACGGAPIPGISIIHRKRVLRGRRMRRAAGK